MGRFKSLFGIDQKDIRKTVLLLPFIPAKALATLGVEKLTCGTVFASASTDNLTIIKTGIGAAFVGDAVLYLKETPCERIIFLGSCGVINKTLGLKVGDLVTLRVAYGFESFTDILTTRLQDPIPGHPDDQLLEDFTKTTGLSLKRLGCVSFSSLAQEEILIPAFERLGADVIEMECAALFHAATKIGKPAIALLFVSDILGEKSFFAPLSATDKKSLANGVSQACQAINKFLSA